MQTKQTAFAPITHKKLVGRLRKFGFDGPYPGGKHLFMIKDGMRLTIPNPHRKAVGGPLLLKVLKQAGIDRNAWVQE